MIRVSICLISITLTNPIPKAKLNNHDLTKAVYNLPEISALCHISETPGNRLAFGDLDRGLVHDGVVREDRAVAVGLAAALHEAGAHVEGLGAARAQRKSEHLKKADYV